MRAGLVSREEEKRGAGGCLTQTHAAADSPWVTFRVMGDADWSGLGCGPVGDKWELDSTTGVTGTEVWSSEDR